MAAGALRQVIAEAGVAAAASELFADCEITVLSRAALQPRTPFEGALFTMFAGLTGGDVIGIVVPGVWRGADVADGSAASAAAPAPRALAVGDHVNLALRGPLTGRWPAGRPRSFPCMTGIYQPAVVRAFGGAPVYSEDVVVAGVRDASRLTPFERHALGEIGAAAFTDCLVPAAVAAAFHGLKVAACVVSQVAHERE